MEIKPEYSTHRSLISIRPGMMPAIPGLSEWGGIRKEGYGKTDREDLPLVSVITVVKNNAGSLGETIKSVIHQSYPNIEFLIIDGGSDDGTLEIIRQNSNTIDIWISGKDSGIYDAMNKGLGLATGRYVHFLNADDHYTHQRVVEIVMDDFLKNPGIRWIHSNVLMLDGRKGRGWIRYSDVSRYYYLFKGIPQQAFFFEKKLFEEFGFFNLEYSIVADLDFLLRIMLLHRITGRYLNTPVVVFDTGGISGNMERKKAERTRVLKKYYPGWVYFLLRNRMMKYLLLQNEARNRKKSILERVMSRF